MVEIKLMPSPRHVDISITGKCNLACEYCFYADEMVARTNLTTERWLTFFDELGSLGVMTVTLTGGEVFTRGDLFELIDGITNNHMRYSLLTNGTLISEDTIEILLFGKRRMRMDSIQVSIDGSSADIHDLSRPKSFTRALRGLRLLKEAGFPITARVTINRRNIDDLENVARLLLEDVGLKSISTNEAYSCGATDRSKSDIILSPEQRQKAMIVLSRLSKQYGSRIQAQAGPMVYAREIKMMGEMIKKGEHAIPGRGYLSSCGGAFNKIAIHHDGTIAPCHNLSTLKLGMIGKDPIKDIWLGHPTMVALRNRSQIPLDSLDTCRECEYKGFCAGGCPGGAVHANGDLNSRNPMDCIRVIKGQDPFFSLSPTGDPNAS